MRIHIQNASNDQVFTITPAQWQEACARAGADPLEISIGETAEEFAAAIGEAEALVIATDTVRHHFPAAAPRLALLFCMSAGLDRLAPFDWLPPGAALLNNRGTHGRKAGEYVLMALLMLVNRIPELIADRQAQRWEKRYGAMLQGKRVTIVGLGDLGGSAAEQAAQFGLHVTGVRTRAAPHHACAEVVGIDALDAVLPRTDFLVLACPLTDRTRGLLDRRRIGLLPAGGSVINIGRGALIDQEALCDALDAGHLAGAVLDVFTPEPVPPGHRLWTTRNLVMTPHVSCDDPGLYNVTSLGIFLANLRAYQTGQTLPNRFDTRRGY
jgi:glyoxylate/hydroxypyruvate reductase